MPLTPEQQPRTHVKKLKPEKSVLRKMLAEEHFPLVHPLGWLFVRQVTLQPL